MKDNKIAVEFFIPEESQKNLEDFINQIEELIELVETMSSSLEQLKENKETSRSKEGGLRDFVFNLNQKLWNSLIKHEKKDSTTKRMWQCLCNDHIWTSENDPEYCSFCGSIMEEVKTKGVSP